MNAIKDIEIRQDPNTNEYLLYLRKTQELWDEGNRYQQVGDFFYPKSPSKVVHYEYGEVYRSSDIFSVIGFKSLIENGHIRYDQFKLKSTKVIDFNNE